MISSVPAPVQQWRMRQMVQADESAILQIVADLEKKADKLTDNAHAASATRRRASILRAAIPKKGHAAVFTVSGMHSLHVNAMRRTLVADVRTLAVDVAVVYANTSNVVDELLAHRIAHVPLACPRHVLENDEYTCTITLQVRQDPLPSGVVAGVHLAVDVMSDALVCSDPSVQILPGVRVLRMMPGQHVHVLCAARPGTGREHTKWRCAFTAASKSIDTNTSEIRVETNHQMTAKEAILAAATELSARLRVCRESLKCTVGSHST